MRTVGVEEELLLVDARTGVPTAVAAQILQVAAHAGEGGVVDLEHGAMVHELQQQQLETCTPPESDMARLGDHLRAWRRRAIDRAAEVGARVIAAGTSPLPAQPELVPTDRYLRMAQRFGLTAREHLVSGCHVHIAVESLDEAVGVIDRLRVWLPALLALSVNSPFWGGEDSGYASFRSQVVQRWPTTGPPELFGSLAAYERHVAALHGSGIPMDASMIHADARPSHHYPTVEIRVADACADSDDAVLIAALSRGLVETAAREYAAGKPAPPVPTALLRLANWQASKYGVSDQLLDPVAHRPTPARDVMDQLVAHVAPVLCESGDEPLVREGVKRVLAQGSGAARQREVLARTGSLACVVDHLARVTAGEC